MELSVDVFQGNKQLATFTARPQATGDFEFSVTVNSDAPAMGIPPERGYCRECHDEEGMADLTSGENLLVVTATGPDGQQATAHRRIVVDRSGLAQLVTRIEASGAPLTNLAGVPIVAETEFPVTGSPSADHQSRLFGGNTDSTGRSQFSVESLRSQALHYRVYVPRTIHDGLLVESSGEVGLDVPAGVIQAGSVVVPVRVRAGQVSGTLETPAVPASAAVYAVAQPGGRIHKTFADTSGRFSLTGLPIGRYLIASVDTENGPGITSRIESLDLDASPDAQVTIASAPAPAAVLRGVVARRRRAGATIRLGD